MDIIGFVQPSKALSSRALGAYVYLRLSGAPVTAESLSKAFPEGRKAFLTTLQELRAAGLVRTTRQVVNGKYVTQSYLNDGSPISALLLQLNEPNSNINNIANSFISNKEYIRGRMGDQVRDDYEPSPSYLEPDERAEFLRKQREKRDVAYREMKAQEATLRIQGKASKTPLEWTTDDSAYYFGERVSGMWHVEPWLTVRTRFKAAFGKSRKTYGTTGDVEKLMMDRFFATLEHHKDVKDPEVIWKMFIKQFGTLHIDVMNSMVTDVDKEAAKKVADKQWGDLGV